VGYNEISKAYRIFIPAQRKIIMNRDVEFEENLSYGRSHESSTVIEDEE
jgi:hypothetical protein